ncbi:hypothetical protein NDU88_001992 [Pleurodeles waltl]|uniref:Uncharacterized protein n=1 Tax=Pleurodeles waltl TaxID=8319 RepID=A0AAV7QBE5_PLEWA|nr:hypothetical protein NDU88_001992 [Pleurodeles waltl]
MGAADVRGAPFPLSTLAGDSLSHSGGSREPYLLGGLQGANEPRPRVSWRPGSEQTPPQGLWKPWRGTLLWAADSAGRRVNHRVSRPGSYSFRKICATRVQLTDEHPLPPPSSMVDATQSVTVDHILQEISAVGRKLEGMDTATASLTAETKSMSLDIAGFQAQVTGLDQQVTSVETHIASWVDRDQELLYLRSKLINLEDRSRRNNVCLLGFPENIEGADIHSYLRETLPKLTGITFDPPLKFQRVHRLGPKRRDGTNCATQS